MSKKGKQQRRPRSRLQRRRSRGSVGEIRADLGHRCGDCTAQADPDRGRAAVPDRSAPLSKVLRGRMDSVTIDKLTAWLTAPGHHNPHNPLMGFEGGVPFAAKWDTRPSANRPSHLSTSIPREATSGRDRGAHRPVAVVPSGRARWTPKCAACRPEWPPRTCSPGASTPRRHGPRSHSRICRAV